MFGKWFASAYTGSMYGAGPEVFAVWGWVVANAGAKGVLEINPRVLAGLIGAKPEAMTKAIAYLCAPDPESRTDDLDGARLEHIEAFTYRVVNHAQYRAARNEEERREYKTQKQREYRERDKPHCPQVSTVDNVDRGGPKAEGRRQSSEAEVKEPTSEPSGMPTEIAPSHDAPGEPEAPLGSEDTSGVAKAPHDGTSQASEAVAVVKPKRKRKPKKPREPSPGAVKIAQALYDAISVHSPDVFGGDTPESQAKTLYVWTLEIDRGLKAKEVTVDDALLVIAYAHHPDDVAGNNGFTWHTNMCAGESMRGQWKKKTLLAKAKRWRDGKDQGKRGGIGKRAMNFDFVGAKKRQDELFGEGTR